MADRRDDAVALRENWATRPDARRLEPSNSAYTTIMDRHAASVERGLPTYADPASGFSVFTAAFLAKRGYCCESGCRHCPFVC